MMIRSIILFMLILTVAKNSVAQFSDSLQLNTEIMEQQLENATANNSDIETEDDSYLQTIQQFRRNHLNINTADENELSSLQILSPFQIASIINYRKLLGTFISIYELQAIPLLDINTIQQIIPFISVNNNEDDFTSMLKRFTKGTHSLLTRFKQIAEKSKGYLIRETNATNFYEGSPLYNFTRYKYVYKNLLQYGFSVEKDAGESFLKGAQKNGFDFYSAHFFIRNWRYVKALALGDYTVNLGQGLTQWQNWAYTKGSNVLGIKRESPVLMPYNSSGEIYFHRGAGITLGNNHLQSTFFVSFRNTDANDVLDTLNHFEFVSSLQTSGYHRTKNEINDKGILHQKVFGGNISFSASQFHIGINNIHYAFNLPIQKQNYPYNLYALSGNNLSNSSMDYSYTFRNTHFFGEIATDNHLNPAAVSGLLISVDRSMDMGFLYRNISKKYQSLNTNAFTENTLPSNERGMYSAISVHPNNAWQVNAYADFFSFPWLKYQVNAPSSGKDFLIQLVYTPNKKLFVYSRFYYKEKQKNGSIDSFNSVPLTSTPTTNWLTDWSIKVNPLFTIKTRTELLWYDPKTNQHETGFLTFIDFYYLPARSRWSGNMRLQYFETDSYNSRLYAYENSVLYAISIPVFYGKGNRYYLNAKYMFSKKCSCWFRVAQTMYQNQQTIGSGLDIINGNKKTEFVFQTIWRF